MDGESASRALGAASDLVELLRLAQSSAARIAQDVHAVCYEHAHLIQRELQRLRRSAETLQRSVEDDVARAQPAGGAFTTSKPAAVSKSRGTT